MFTFIGSACRLAILSLFVFGCPNLALAQQDGSGNFLPGEVIVGFKSLAATEKAFRELKEVEKTIKSTGGVKTRSGTSNSLKVEKVGKQSVRIQLSFQDNSGVPLRGPKALTSIEEYAELLRQKPEVEFAHPNWILKLNRKRILKPVHLEDIKQKPRIGVRLVDPSLPNDPVFRKGLHWHYGAPPAGINAIQAWKAKAMGSRKVVVAVLDTGILPRHPDLKGSKNLLKGHDFISISSMEADAIKGRDTDPTDPGDGCPSDGQPNSWHGTHVSGTVGAAQTNNKLGMAGINWNVSVLPVRVLGRCGGSIADLAAAIRWSAGLPVIGTPKNKTPADVINLSLGIELPCTSQNFALLINAIDESRKAGSLIVVAAGNESRDIKDVTPAGCKNVLSVAASDQRGHLAPYSNFGNVDILAPGGDLTRDDDNDGSPDGVWSIVAITEEKPSGVAAYEGTSMATPHVSGAIAIVIMKRPDLRRKPNQIRKHILTNTTKLPSSNCAKPCGKGLLDLNAMISSAR